MPNRISKWFKKTKEVEVSEELIPEVPSLPTTRQHSLTPKSSQQDLSQSSDYGKATSQSGLFRTLPPEIRRKILEEAFGNRRLHIDLILDHPPQYPAPYNGHANLPLSSRDIGESSDTLRINTSVPKRWIWRGSVCHRDGPNPGPPGHRIQPSHDLCRFGLTGSETCKTWPGEQPGKCFIGTMGWLLTCRQAYTEGIDVLFSTNSFHTASKPLLSNSTNLILPQRLARIPAVELIWEIEEPPVWNSGSGEAYKTLRSFWDFLDAVPKVFSNAKSILIAVQWSPKHKIALPTTMSELFFAFAEGGILNRVESMVRKLGPHVTDFSLAIPSSMYRPRRDRARRNGLKVEQAWKGGQLERYWSPISGSSSREGYWIRLGLRDITMPQQSSGTDEASDPRLNQEDWIMFEPSRY